MNNDSISRSALKKTFAKYGEKAKFTQGACQQLIDNAPTVEEMKKPFITECRDAAIKEDKNG